MANEFDFDDLMKDTERELDRREGVRGDLDAIGTLAVASVFFSAASMLYIEERLRDPLASPAEAMERAKDRAKAGVEEFTRPYMAEMLEYNDITSKGRFNSLEDAVENAVSTENDVCDKAFMAIEGLVRRSEPFYYFCTAASGRDPQDHLNRIREEGEGFDNLLDGLNW